MSLHFIIVHYISIYSHYISLYFTIRITRKLLVKTLDIKLGEKKCPAVLRTDNMSQTDGRTDIRSAQSIPFSS